VDFAKVKVHALNMFANPLRDRREALGLTQPQLAALAGISDETIRNAEQGKRVRPGTLRRIQEALTNQEAAREPVAQPKPTNGGASSDVPHSVSEPEVSEHGRSIITVRADAIGVTLTIDYDGPEDRSRALAEAMWALGIERGNSSEGLHPPKGGDNAS
jgi:transcriptional regulator with XRE-family HTH domain